MRGLFHRRVVAPADADTRAEPVAYTCLEEARLRVEWLGSCLPHEPDRQADADLRACHRHLGLAGFHCCAALGSGVRLQWLALAYDRLRVDQRDPVKGSLDALVRATDAVEEALIATDLAEHIQSAHCHILAACESFSAYLQISAAK